MPSHPSIDIVLITQDRIDLLFKTLESIHLAVRDFPIRLLLGFNGTSNENEIAILRALADRNTQYLAHRIESLNPGGARNALLKESKSDWIFFCDDDIVIPETLFLDFYTLARENPTILLIGGPNLTPPESSPFEVAQGLALGNPLVTGPMADRYRLKSMSFLAMNSRSLTLCNFFLKNIGQIEFPNHYICGEELMLISATPPPYLVSPKLFAYHYRRRTYSAFFKQTIKYGIGRSDFSLVAGLAAIIGLCLLFLMVPPWAILLYIIYLFLIVIHHLMTRTSQGEGGPIVATNLAVAAAMIHTGYAIGLTFGVVHNLAQNLARDRT